MRLNSSKSIEKWDEYFYNLCKAVSAKSPCLSRNIGCLIVRDNSVVSTGYNGPPRGYPHCKPPICPRKKRGYASGEGLHECPSAHAEANAIVNAARLGVCVRGCSLYLNTLIPCKDCMSLIINSGISEIICEEVKPYHVLSLDIARFSKVSIRQFSHLGK